MELSFVDLGEATIDFAASGPGGVGAVSVVGEISGFGVAAVGSWPVHDRVDLVGKLGLFRWDVDGEEEYFVIGSFFDQSSESEDGTDPFFGIGANFAVTSNFALRAEWERYTNVGDEIGGIDFESDVDFFGISAIFSFR